ncbi:MAG: 16S rRNA (guanine(527)-N(7))-methyltransferase RsmG [Bacteroidales bacterium]|nr:16S rRNA (guanine(527)-N(7))-methyltransferase RsmG [Bacteroidales bacterium]
MSLQLIHKYFPGLDAGKYEQFARLDELYRYWNERINVVSRKDIDNLYLHHVLHSLAIAKFFGFIKGTKLLDAGTGGGFPGIPLAIMFPECQFHLVDSIAKKLKVVDAVARDIGLENVSTSHSRMEKLKGRYDFVLGRAITELPKFIAFTRKLIKKQGENDLKNGIIYLKGGEVEKEIPAGITAYKIYELSSIFDEAFFDTKNLVYISNFQDYEGNR